MLGLLGVTWVGVLPPIVTVTVSTDCLPFAAVITSSAHCAGGALRCWTAQAGTPLGTVPRISVSLQLTPVSARATPSLPTRATVPGPLPKP